MADRGKLEGEVAVFTGATGEMVLAGVRLLVADLDSLFDPVRQTRGSIDLLRASMYRLHNG